MPNQSAIESLGCSEISPTHPPQGVKNPSAMHYKCSTFISFCFGDGIKVFLSFLDTRLRGTNGETEKVVQVLKYIV